MLRETVNLVNKRKSEGCIAVEMEVAGVQAVCDFYGFELYDFLAAGDVLVEGGYTIDELSDANHNLDKLLVALQIIERI
jgi:uridine phosphorylase